MHHFVLLSLLAMTSAQLVVPNGPAFPSFPWTLPQPGPIMTNMFPWLSNNIPTRALPGAPPIGLTQNSFFPWAGGGGLMQQALQAGLQVPLQGIQAFTNLFRPPQLNTLGVFTPQISSPADGPTLQSLNRPKPVKPSKPEPATPEQEVAEEIAEDPAYFPLPEPLPGQVNTPGSDLLSGLLQQANAKKESVDAPLDDVVSD